MHLLEFINRNASENPKIHYKFEIIFSIHHVLGFKEVIREMSIDKINNSSPKIKMKQLYFYHRNFIARNKNFASYKYLYKNNFLWKEKLISNNKSSASEMKISSVYQCQTQMKINSLSWSIWTLCCNDYMFLLSFKIIGLLPQYIWQS